MPEMNHKTVNNIADHYKVLLNHALNSEAMNQVSTLADALLDGWLGRKTIYLCGNGGSAGNAIHLANDLLHGAGVSNGCGLRVEAISANPAVLTCLANDLGYENIYSEQLRVKANQGDILIALSGSGNSPNIVKAIETANKIGMKTFAILGFDGGLCKSTAHFPIHFDVDDMQIAEDLQLVVGHICMKFLSQHNVKG